VKELRKKEEQQRKELEGFLQGLSVG
jgi:hypothetical protein